MSQRKWQNFTYSEFRCKKLLKDGTFETCKHCGGTNETSEKLISLLDFIRNLIRTPMVINSGFRCEKRNKEAGGKEDSEHTTGHGADIRCETSAMRYLLIDTALSMGFKRMGIGNGFLHLGISKDRPSEVIWIYP